jgi:hypothetical protein
MKTKLPLGTRIVLESIHGEQFYGSVKNKCGCYRYIEAGPYELKIHCNDDMIDECEWIKDGYLITSLAGGS